MERNSTGVCHLAKADTQKARAVQVKIDTVHGCKRKKEKKETGGWERMFYESHVHSVSYRSWKSLTHPNFDNRYFHTLIIATQFIINIKYKTPKEFT